MEQNQRAAHGGEQMVKSRRDSRGRALKPGEVQRSKNKKYIYTYTDPLGRRRFIYANDLPELREKEKKLIKLETMIVKKWLLKTKIKIMKI